LTVSPEPAPRATLGPKRTAAREVRRVRLLALPVSRRPKHRSSSGPKPAKLLSLPASGPSIELLAGGFAEHHGQALSAREPLPGQTLRRAACGAWAKGLGALWAAELIPQQLLDCGLKLSIQGPELETDQQLARNMVRVLATEQPPLGSGIGTASTGACSGSSEARSGFDLADPPTTQSETSTAEQA